MNKFLFISQVMEEKTMDEIIEERERAIKIVSEKYPDEVIKAMSVIKRDSLNPLISLSASIRHLSKVDIAYFCEGWQNSKECQIENICCEKFNIEKIEE